MPVKEPYRKQFTSQPLPQPQPQSAGNFLRQTSQQQANLAKKSYQAAMETYDNTFSSMANQKISEAYSANKNNPTELQKQLKSMEPELLKPIKNAQKREELGLKFTIMAQPFVEKAEKLFRKQQTEELQTSIMVNFDTTKRNAEDTSELLFGDSNNQATVKYALSYWTGFDALTKAISMKDDLGNALLSPNQKASRIQQYNNDVLSAGTRGYFDNASMQEKYKFYQQYQDKEANILVPDPKTKAGFSEKSVDNFIDRQTYEQDLRYMERFISKFESKAKGNESKSKKIADLALLETRASMQIEAALNEFEVNKKGKVTNKNNFEDMASYTNIVYDAQAKGLISQDEAEGYLRPINESFIENIDNMKIKWEHKEGYWNPFKENKLSAWGQGIKDMNGYIEDIGQGENKNLKRDLYMAYYNGLKDAEVDIKSFNKDALEKSGQVLENVKRRFAESQYPELATFRKQTLNAALGDEGYFPITPKQPEKPAQEKTTMPGYNTARDAQGNEALVKRDSTGKIIDYKEVK